MSVLIGMVSDDGVLLGGQGNTTAEALDGLCSLLGEEAQIAYAKAHSELSDRIDQLADGIEANPRSIAAATTDDAAAGGDGDSGRPAGTRQGSSAVGGGVEKVRDDQEEQEEKGEEEEKVEAEFVCAICGVEVGKARAEVSTDEYGEVRCKNDSG